MYGILFRSILMMNGVLIIWFMVNISDGFLGINLSLNFFAQYLIDLIDGLIMMSIRLVVISVGLILIFW